MRLMEAGSRDEVKHNERNDQLFVINEDDREWLEMKNDFCEEAEQ